MDNTNQQDILDIIQHNEKKSKLRLITFISISMLLAGLTVYFGLDSQNKSIQLELQNDKIEKQALELAIAQDSLKLFLSKIESQVLDTTIKSEIKQNIKKFSGVQYIVGTYNNIDNDGFVNLRSSPKGKIIKKINVGEIFHYISTDNTWSKVRTNDGYEGYIKSDRIKPLR